MAGYYLVGNTKVYYAGGKDSPLQSVTGAPVNYEEIKSKHSPSNLFEDPDFPADIESVGQVGGDISVNSGKLTNDDFKWLRPHALCKELEISRPDFASAENHEFQDGKISAFSATDLRQGMLGDCWYLASLGSLASKPDVISFIIPEDNFIGFDDDKYCGAFHFRFFSLAESKWVDVVVDDRIPSLFNGKIYKSAFASITSKLKFATIAEFWPVLIEKAYAKFIGSYEKIEGGYSCQAIGEFTDGFSEIMVLNEEFTVGPSKLSKYDILKAKIEVSITAGFFVGLDTYGTPESAYENGCLDGYSDYEDFLHPDGRLTHETYGYALNPSTGKFEPDRSDAGKGTGSGLILTHAYTILDAKEVKCKHTQFTYFLLKVRNPHATHEWSGVFCDSDDYNWSNLEEDLRSKKADGSTDIDEGEFWIELSDVLKYFVKMEFCFYGKDSTFLRAQKGVWPAKLQKEVLILAPSNLHNFTAYKIELKKENPDIYVPPEYRGQGEICLFACAIVLGGYHAALEPNPRFCFYLYKVTEADLAKPLSDIYTTSRPTIISEVSTGRESSKMTFVAPGTYIVVPALDLQRHPPGFKCPLPDEMLGKDVPFTIRIFSENETTIEEVKPQKPRLLAPWQRKMKGFVEL